LLDLVNISDSDFKILYNPKIENSNLKLAPAQKFLSLPEVFLVGTYLELGLSAIDQVKLNHTK
jgi:hypothetical protein